MKRWILGVGIVAAALALIAGGAAFAAFQSSARDDALRLSVEVHGPMMRGRWGGEGLRLLPRAWLSVADDRELNDDMERALAEGMGLTLEDLTARLNDGESLRSIAEAEGLSESELETLWTSAWEGALESAVVDGALTPAQADWMLQHMQSLGPGHPRPMWGAAGASCPWRGNMGGGFFERHPGGRW